MRFSKGEVDLLRKNKLCALATLLDGAPHVVPVTYLFFSGCVWIRLDPGSRKYRNILADDRVAVVVYTYHPDKGVMLRGRAHFVKKGTELRRVRKEYYKEHQRTEKEYPFVKIVATSKASWSDRREEKDGKVVWIHQTL